MESGLTQAISLLNELSNDNAVSRNIKKAMNEALSILNDEAELPVKCDKAIQILSITEDHNMDMFIKTRIWSLLSILESVSNA